MKLDLRSVCEEYGIITGDETDKEVRRLALAYIKDNALNTKGSVSLTNGKLANIIAGRGEFCEDTPFNSLYVSVDIRWFSSKEQTCEVCFVMQGLPTHEEVWAHIKANQQKFINDAIVRANRQFKQYKIKHELTDYGITKFRYSPVSRELEVGINVKR